MFGYYEVAYMNSKPSLYIADYDDLVATRAWYHALRCPAVIKKRK